MTTKVKYADEPIGNPRVIVDFLPPPEDLAIREEGVKITLALSKRSVEFFKREAQKHNTQYQRMIRRLLDAYAERYTQRSCPSAWCMRRISRTAGSSLVRPSRRTAWPADYR
jgi:hypothetical protein